MITLTRKVKNKITPEHLFMISVLLVSGGNYLYNLLLGRFLGPEKFADAAVLITFLLVLSFLAMTFQLVTAKFLVAFDGDTLEPFIAKTFKYALATGIGLGALIIIFSSELQTFFKISSVNTFIVFGLGVPIYFMMSVNRGLLQGKKEFTSLSVTYQAEMLSRLVLTMGLLMFLEIDTSSIVSIGIFCSFLLGLVPFKYKRISFVTSKVLGIIENKMVRNFFIVTAFYELTQILINNSDILLVKHYFDGYNAGLYASLALIGRVVYFIAWMFVMLLLPTVVQLKKEGKPTLSVLLKYVSAISLITILIILGCLLFPNQIIYLLFGGDYLEVVPLLWKYALATGVFAISNIFAYYYLSIDEYTPVILSGLFGMLQIVLVIFFHKSLEEVVHMQIIAMSLLLAVQLSFFLWKYYKDKAK
ncbi:sugar isomerase [Tenacibaculum maritimum]|uniref:sugar isomerase n=1 Tax=Tenacibaculum maritimum TaxID=107401 RepID=UPI0012E4FB06|nr:sugar isomerase [Tenacibaculum maritimum]MCD9561724.1 sugar isomerase [Tenacibaculum maritimum]MCD9565160.1 sugar isomerase [Tenacibaculum maritimum]MCD9578560.1 sugar isomerase [Tenacibaculum maritimum]MCD9596577.1 sugar isomerase [Tenacibaculum maritimum]MCD9612861.1 sugar isomerase [Tenacibaculum maritimum]